MSYGINPLRTRTLITVDEVLFHAPTDKEPDARFILSSIIVAERRFIKNDVLGPVLYAALINKKNLVVTPENLAQVQQAFDATRGNRPKISLVAGDMVNSDLFLNGLQRQLWQDYLHKIVAECVFFAALPTNRARFTAQGVQVNNPANPMAGAGSASVELRDLKHLMDVELQQRILPMIEDMHQWLCQSAYPGYTKDCSCSAAGVPYQRRSPVLFSMYDEEKTGCCDDEPAFSLPAAAPLSETVPFSETATFELPWTAARRERFGYMPSLKAFVITDGSPLLSEVVGVPDKLLAPTKFTFTFGETVSGQIIVA